MQSWCIAVFTRACLGILMILNGPANALALFVASGPACACSVGTDRDKDRKPCCGRCSGATMSEPAATPKDDGSKIRPTCPLCPSCPHVPNSCCVSCPCKAPSAPQPLFAMPETPDLVWYLIDDDISFAHSSPDQPVPPPRVPIPVALTI